MVVRRVLRFEPLAWPDQAEVDTSLRPGCSGCSANRAVARTSLGGYGSEDDLRLMFNDTDM